MRGAAGDRKHTTWASAAQVHAYSLRSPSSDIYSTLTVTTVAPLFLSPSLLVCRWALKAMLLLQRMMLWLISSTVGDKLLIVCRAESRMAWWRAFMQHKEATVHYKITQTHMWELMWKPHVLPWLSYQSMCHVFEQLCMFLFDDPCCHVLVFLVSPQPAVPYQWKCGSNALLFVFFQFGLVIVSPSFSLVGTLPVVRRRQHYVSSFICLLLDLPQFFPTSLMVAKVTKGSWDLHDFKQNSFIVNSFIVTKKPE